MIVVILLVVICAAFGVLFYDASFRPGWTCPVSW